MTEEVGELMQEYFMQLRREYLVEAPARLGELRKDLAAVRAGEPDAHDSLRSRFHKLAGSGGSYGFPAITDASRDAEEWLAEHPSPDDDGFALLGAAIGRVAAAFDDAARELGFPSITKKPPPFGWRAHLVGGASDLTARLTTSLRDAKYAVTTASLDADPASIPASERPEIVVLIAPPGEPCREVVERWTAGPFERYLAVALVADPGGVNLLRQPYSHLELFVERDRADQEIPRWARAVARAATAPTKALVVLLEDAERDVVVGWLETAGMVVSVASSGSQAEEAMRKELHDVVLLDWALPEGEAPALVRLMRRSTRFARMPVVAITSFDTDAEREQAVGAGVDELLVRPFSQARLIPALIHRAGRARLLEETAHRDPLTGLLMEGALHDELELALAAARRGGERLCLLLLDVDHFRRINEQLGADTGDRVLTHLAHVLRERIRASDLLVRVGGEEFGVLLHNCRPADAAAVADGFRRAVVGAPPIVEGTSLPVRLSGGIAGYPDHAVGARELVLAAERALREAKATGRDRVIVAGRLSNGEGRGPNGY